MIDKASAGYVEVPGSSFLCGECAFITEEGKCTDYRGRERNVKPWGASCNDWKPLSKGRIEGNGSATRASTAYVENSRGFGCRRCGHFAVTRPACDEVEGNISGPSGCCDLWAPDRFRARMSDTELIPILKASK